MLAEKVLALYLAAFISYGVRNIRGYMTVGVYLSNTVMQKRLLKCYAN